MRKFFIFVAFIVCFIIAGFCKYDAVNFAFNQSADPKYYFYVTLNTQTEDNHYTQNGNGGIICLGYNELDLLDTFDINTLYGESVKFYGNDNDFEKLIKKYNLSIVLQEKFDNFNIVYGYNKILGDAVEINGKKVNVQIAKRGNEINVGFPLIMGSY